jgi:hypothetical protein
MVFNVLWSFKYLFWFFNIYFVCAHGWVNKCQLLVCLKNGERNCSLFFSRCILRLHFDVAVSNSNIFMMPLNYETKRYAMRVVRLSMSFLHFIRASNGFDNY